MSRLKLLWKLVSPYLLLVVLSLSLLTAFLLFRTHETFRAQKLQTLTQTSQVLATSIQGSLKRGDLDTIHTLIRTIAADQDLRIELADREGRVVVDAYTPLAEMTPRTLPDVKGHSVPKSGFVSRGGAERRFALIPVGTPPLGYLRVSEPVVEDVILGVSNLSVLFLLGLSCLGVTAVISILLARSLAQPLNEMAEYADLFARGNLNVRIPVPSSSEHALLADSLNRMASQLDHTLTTLQEQRNEQQAIFSSMSEGILAFDPEDQIFLVNQSARDLFGMQTDRAATAPLWETVRNRDLHAFLDVLKEKQMHTDEITLYDRGNIQVHVQGSVLRGKRGSVLGYLLVLRDVTRIRRLESMRSEFVANVSHELKTPVTTIKGFVETLMDSDQSDLEERRRYLGIILKHTDRITEIINDLLDLSRLEQDHAVSDLQGRVCLVRDTLQRAAELCEPRTREHNISCRVECADDLVTYHSPDLMEQALVNLVTNAVKFSDPDSHIDLSAEARDQKVFIRVRDYGSGIAEEHLPRLFERFYRVDKARSRHAGGTGLGLAIVKHIAQAHRGQVHVVSKPGQGSIFSIEIPYATEEPAREE